MGEAATKEYMAQRSARKTRRVWLPILLFGACFAVLLGRLVHIQVINHDNYSVQAENTLIGNDILEAPRGKIFDRNGQPLVLSIDTWDLYISTRTWSVNEIAKQAAKAIANETGTSSILTFKVSKSLFFTPYCLNFLFNHFISDLELLFLFKMLKSLFLSNLILLFSSKISGRII